MPSSATSQRLCECLGLSEYEAKVYISLIKKGAARARTLSMMSGVPRTKVYSVLKKLIDMGLIVEIPEEPKRFAPIPPRAALEPYIRSYKSMMDNFLSIVSSLEEILEKSEKKTGPGQVTIWNINGRQEVLRKIRKMMSKAKRSVHVVTNKNGMVLLYKLFNRLFDDLAERSIDVRIATSPGSNNQHILNELKYSCKIDESDFQLPIIFLCTDERHFLLAKLEPNDFSLQSEHDRGVFSCDPVLLEMLYLLIFKEAAPSPFPAYPQQMRREC